MPLMCLSIRQFFKYIKYINYVHLIYLIYNKSVQRLNHHHLYIFWIFGKTSSFTQTAQELSIAQSAVTAQIKQLEENLEVQLINRSNPRRPEITGEGKRVLDYAKMIFETSQELLNWATKGTTPALQTLRIGALSGLSRNLQYEFLKPLLHRADIRFEVTTGDQKNLLKLLTHHDLDVVLSSRNIEEDSQHRLSTYVLTTSPLVLVEANPSPSRKKKKVKKGSKWTDLADGRDIFVPGHYFESKPELDAFFQNLKIKYRIAGEIDDIALLRILALRSGALVAIPRMGVSQDIANGSVRVLAEIPRIHQRFYAITIKKRHPDSMIQFLIESLKDL